MEIERRERKKRQQKQQQQQQPGGTPGSEPAPPLPTGGTDAVTGALPAIPQMEQGAAQPDAEAAPENRRNARDLMACSAENDTTSDVSGWSASTLPQGTNKKGCPLSELMKCPTNRAQSLTRCIKLLPIAQRRSVAQWLLEQKHFSEFKKLFNVRASTSTSDLRLLGGAINDIPPLPQDDVRCHLHLDELDTSVRGDSGLSLLHWVIKYSHDFKDLLNKAPWTLDDLKLTTERGFTALHYAVFFDLDALNLKKLLNIAVDNKAEIHSIWSEAWENGGACVSPLHLAYLYRRDAIVKELLAFGWDPTETMKPHGESPEVDSYDLCLLELGSARAACKAAKKAQAAKKNKAAKDEQESETKNRGRLDRLPVAVQLLHATLLVAVRTRFDAKRPVESIRRTFRLLVDDGVLGLDCPVLEHKQAWEGQKAAVSLLKNTPFNPKDITKCVRAALEDPDHHSSVQLSLQHLLSSFEAFGKFVGTRFDESWAAMLSKRIAQLTEQTNCIGDRAASPDQSPKMLLDLVRSMEERSFHGKVAEKLSTVIPVRCVAPALPMFYLMLFLLFGLFFFFNPTIPESTLTDLENSIHDCTDPYKTDDPKRDGVLPWGCRGFVEVGMQVKTISNDTVPTMHSHFSFLKRENIPRNVTHLPWAFLRFANIVHFDGFEKDAQSLSGLVAPPSSTSQKFWVLTELRKLPKWAPEIFEQRNPGKNDSLITHRAETTRIFKHNVVPHGFIAFGLLIWFFFVSVSLVLASVGFAYTCRVIFKDKVQLVERSISRHALRVAQLLCEFAAISCSLVGVILVSRVIFHHRDDAVIDRETLSDWHRAELFLRVGLLLCSLRAVSFVAQMPKPHHFAIVNTIAVGVILVLTVVALSLPAHQVGIAASIASLMSIRLADVLTLPIVLTVSLLLRSPTISDEVRQAHYEDVRDNIKAWHNQCVNGGFVSEGNRDIEENCCACKKCSTCTWKQIRRVCVLVLACLAQLLLYAVAVFIAVWPFLALRVPGGVLLVNGHSFLSSEDLGLVSAARRFFLRGP